MNEDLNDVFSINAASFLSTNKGESPFYMPSAEKGVDKVYTSQIKFIANIHNPAKSMPWKWTVWSENPETEEKRTIDCPSTIDQPSLLQEAWKALYNSNSAHDKELSKKFNRTKSYYTLVYIVKDEHQPALEGKIKIFKFGTQIWEILEASANDSDDPNDFLDFFNGKTLKLKIVEKTGGNGRTFNNYVQSKFMDKVHLIKIDGEDMTDTPKNRKKLIEWLKENSPDISGYEFKPWDEDTRRFVVDYIKAIIPNESMVQKILKIAKTPVEKPSKINFADEDEDAKIPIKTNVPKVLIDEDEDEDEEDEEINLDDIDDSELDKIDAHISKINKKVPAKPAKASKKPVYDDDEDDD